MRDSACTEGCFDESHASDAVRVNEIADSFGRESRIQEIRDLAAAQHEADRLELERMRKAQW